MASTFTMIANGVMSVDYATIFTVGGSAAEAAPADGDSLVMAGKTLYVDKTINFAAVTATTGSKLIPTNGNVVITITAATLTNPLLIQGSPGSMERVSATSQVAKGVGGLG